MAIRFFLIFLLVACVSAEEKGMAVDQVYDILEKGNFRERKEAVERIDKLSEKDRNRLKEKLRISKDPELQKIFRDRFQKILVIEGELGLYTAQIVMSLVIEGKEVTGSYYYARHQKNIQLQGKYDPDTGSLKITETYKMKETGYFDGILKDQLFTGKWSANKEFKDPYKFKLQSVKTPKEERTFFRYSKEFPMFMAGENEPVVAKVFVNVNIIDDKHFCFYYETWGRNAHRGSIQGIAKLTEAGKFVFSGEENARLTFHFEKNKLKTIAENCDYYAGARADFNWELSRER